MASTVADVMTNEPVSCPASTSVHDVARLMRDRGIGDVLVTEDGKLKGIVTDRDIVVRCLAEGDVSGATVADACSKELTVVEPGMRISDAAELMGRLAVRRLPVVDRGRPVGIVSLGDLAVERDPESVLGQISAAPAGQRT
jgi:CBS domain-containing protein